MGSSIAARGLSSCGMWAPEYTGSVVVVCGLSSSLVSGILVLDQGSNLCPLHYKVDS